MSAVANQPTNALSSEQMRAKVRLDAKEAFRFSQEEEVRANYFDAVNDLLESGELFSSAIPNMDAFEESQKQLAQSTRHTRKWDEFAP